MLLFDVFTGGRRFVGRNPFTTQQQSFLLANNNNWRYTIITNNHHENPADDMGLRRTQQKRLRRDDDTCFFEDGSTGSSRWLRWRGSRRIISLLLTAGSTHSSYLLPNTKTKATVCSGFGSIRIRSLFSFGRPEK